ncbi:MAG: sulfatase-like hydrolase/transferase [Balneolaceae bacterium]
MKSETLSTGLQLTLAFLLTGILLRAYEFLLVSANFVVPEHALRLYLSGLFIDLFFYSFLGLIFLLAYLLLTLLNKRVAWVITALLMIFSLILNVLLIQYFAELLVPLGSDLFAYNLTEIRDTAQTSVQISTLRVIPLVLFPGLYLLFCFLFGTVRWNRQWIAGGTATLLVFAVGFLFLNPAENQFEQELDYSLSVNKSAYFLGDALSGLFGGGFSDYSGPEYPLLGQPETGSNLAPFFREFDRTPNLVFIVVEGLGGVVMPPYDKYGGFTPYLDSLAAESLYWTHFLSTSGRSFNAMPSIFGSLPYGERGFMELGHLAPEHHSLISILNDNGYHTAYFCGYESRFDKLDQFLERQQIDLLMDASRFTGDYQKMDEIEGGFTWGYSDKNTFRRAFELLEQTDLETSRLDIYFTLNFHEPFLVDEPEFYRQRFLERLAEMDGLSESRREEYLQYSNLFMALLYTDDAIRELMHRYRDRDDYEDTIFVITGDHRMIPVPHRNRIDRYYVPFLIYSPRLEESVQFEGVSSHLDVTPSILSFLQERGHIETPGMVHWLGGELSVSREFEATSGIPFMRNKNQMMDYLSGSEFLAGDQLFRLEQGMLLRPVDNEESLQKVAGEFEEFQAMNRYVTTQNKILRGSRPTPAELAAAESDPGSILHETRHLNLEEQFFRARELAFTGDYRDARILLRRILQESPNFHDARLLLGRTYGWEGEYADAALHFDEVLRRNPELLDAYIATTDLQYWQEVPEKSIEAANRGLTIHPESVPLLFRLARAFQQRGDSSEAREVLNRAIDLDPNHDQLRLFRQQLDDEE